MIPNWLRTIGRTRADDLKDSPTTPSDKEHVHFHEHSNGRHAHWHRHPSDDYRHAHSHLTAPPSEKVGHS